jgi:hypothetical protein
VLAPHDVGGSEQDAAAVACRRARPPRAVVERPPGGVDGAFDVGSLGAASSL